jgi:hypothetical protein
MSQQDAVSTTRLTGAFARVWHAVKRVWATDGYRPEAHYMRGPDPEMAGKTCQTSLGV